ncbi:hypothetical protein U8V72_21460 [Priestia filamentosa]|uniref:hypothetical protein n=1 Tax=Priestia filamentosa TaxID=1402861 RepID=UPI00397C28C1
MALFFQVKGRPIRIREAKYAGETVVCLDFEESSKAAPPAKLPKPEEITATAIINPKQWNKLLNSVRSQGDTIEKGNQVLIKGELAAPVDYEISESDITYIGFDLQYFAFKEDEKPEDITIDVDASLKTEISSSTKKKVVQKKNGKSHALYSKYMRAIHDLSEEELHLHKIKNGVCDECGQRCDKRVIRVVEKNDEKQLICAQCYFNMPMLQPRIHPKFLEVFAKKVNLSTEEAEEFLLTFPKKYALLTLGINYRQFWSWDVKHHVGTVCVNKYGWINKIELRNLTAKKKTEILKADQVLKRRSGKAKTLYIKDVPFIIKLRTKLNISDIAISDRFKQFQPREGKVEEKMAYYEEKQRFKKSLVVEKKEDHYKLLDGYASYLAAQNLNLTQVEVLIVTNTSKKEVN